MSDTHRVPFFHPAPQPDTAEKTRDPRVPAPRSGGPLAAHVIAAATSRSRRDRAVSGRIAGSPSSHRMRGRLHASRRPSRACFRADRTGNPKLPRAPRAPRVWVFGSSLGFLLSFRSPLTARLRFEGRLADRRLPSFPSPTFDPGDSYDRGRGGDYGGAFGGRRGGDDDGRGRDDSADPAAAAGAAATIAGAAAAAAGAGRP